jgi:lipopolysaccharide assembly protein A
MSNRNKSTLSDVRRTKASTLWVMTAIAVILLLLLAIFIAQNGQEVEVHFLGADGSVSLALGLLFSALAGAGVVLLAGVIRIVQLRLAGRRHMRGHTGTPATSSGTTSAGAAPGGDAQPIETQPHPDDARP